LFFPVRLPDLFYISLRGNGALHGEVTMPSIAPSFERLQESVTIIARHADFPGKQQVVAECLDDIEDRWRQGQLTLEQRFQLYATLLRGTCAAPAHAPTG
jgi:hypothetical protein